MCLLHHFLYVEMFYNSKKCLKKHKRGFLGLPSESQCPLRKGTGPSGNLGVRRPGCWAPVGRTGCAARNQQLSLQNPNLTIYPRPPCIGAAATTSPLDLCRGLLTGLPSSALAPPPSPILHKWPQGSFKNITQILLLFQF